MKFLLAIALASFTTQVSAEICQKLEFAELDSLSKEELLKMRCKYHQTMFDISDLDIAEHCAEQLTRMDRILVKKYKLKSDNDQSITKISAMCRAKP